MVIVETPAFTRKITTLMSEEEYRLLQIELIARPETGKVIKHGGGIRKLRWKARGHGKRGGARIIYFWAVSQEKVLLLSAFAKNEQKDLTPAELESIRTYVEQEYK